MKKVSSRIVKSLIVLSFAFGLFFLTPDFVKETQAEVAPCSLYGFHQMHAEGTATVKYKETKENAITLGTMYKCACGASIVTTGRPPGHPIGKYATDPELVIGFGGHVTYETSKKNVRSTSSYSLPGYRFY